MTRKIVALCLLILIPVTLNCMAASDITSAWAHVMGKGRMGTNWVTAFEIAAFIACATIPGIGLLACGLATIA